MIMSDMSLVKLVWIILLYTIISPALSQCERAALTCSDLTQTVTIWGGSSTGLILGQYTNDQLLFVGCKNSMCTFSCIQHTDSMTFRSLNSYPFRMYSVLGPSPIPSNGAVQCATPSSVNNIIDAPDDASSVTKLCQQIGYKVGSFTTWTGSYCASALWNGMSWTTDWISSDGVVTASITCSQKCTAAPTNIPTHSPSNLPTYAPSHIPTYTPTYFPTTYPTTNIPTLSPTTLPTSTSAPTTRIPTERPTKRPTKPTNTPTNIELHDEAVQESTAIATTHDSSVENEVSTDSAALSLVWINGLILGVIACTICILIACYVRKRKTRKLQNQKQCERIVSTLASQVVAGTEGFDSQSPTGTATVANVYWHGMVEMVGITGGGIHPGNILSVGSDKDMDVIVIVSTAGNMDGNCNEDTVGSVSVLCEDEDVDHTNSTGNTVDMDHVDGIISSATTGNCNTTIVLQENEFVVEDEMDNGGDDMVMSNYSYL